MSVPSTRKPKKISVSRVIPAGAPASDFVSLSRPRNVTFPQMMRMKRQMLVLSPKP